jgi:ribosomal-protein-serine acetyltransferase
MFRQAVGNGVELRLFEEYQAAELFSAIDRDRERLRRWFPWVDRTLSEADSRNFIRMGLRHYASQEGLHLGIWQGETLAGGMGCQKMDWANRATAIGYWLTAGYEGRGIITRSVESLLDRLFTEFRLHRVEIRCAVENTRSCAVPGRLGFTREGVLRDAEWVNGRFHDLVVWSLLETDWRSHQA